MQKEGGRRSDRIPGAVLADETVVRALTRGPLWQRV